MTSGDLLNQNPGTLRKETSGDAFKASHGLFNNFKKRTGVHNIVSNGGAVSSDIKTAKDFSCEFFNLITTEGCITQQVLSLGGGKCPEEAK